MSAGAASSDIDDHELRLRSQAPTPDCGAGKDHETVDNASFDNNARRRFFWRLRSVSQ